MFSSFIPIFLLSPSLMKDTEREKKRNRKKLEWNGEEQEADSKTVGWEEQWQAAV